MGASLIRWISQRVVAAVLSGGMWRNQAAKQFGWASSTAINWVKRQQGTSSVAPGHKSENDFRRAAGLATDQGWRLHVAADFRTEECQDYLEEPPAAHGGPGVILGAPVFSGSWHFVCRALPFFSG